MTLWVLAGVTVAVIGTVLVRRRRSRRTRVSPQWLIDSERRAWTVGVDQVGFRGPFGR